MTGTSRIAYSCLMAIEENDWKFCKNCRCSQVVTGDGGTLVHLDTGWPECAEDERYRPGAVAEIEVICECGHGEQHHPGEPWDQRTKDGQGKTTWKRHCHGHKGYSTLHGETPCRCKGFTPEKETDR
ncbi:hypothetical protein SEA_APIARY_77 [Rhodococcus phage Apiary]|nr:hypothetical protein SEA_APIARY_77 [Rhodococcus phage Apiary]